jgi:hypothetical protein
VMPTRDRTPVAVSMTAQILMWGRSTRHRSTGAMWWQNGLSDPRRLCGDFYVQLYPE